MFSGLVRCVGVLVLLSGAASSRSVNADSLLHDVTQIVTGEVHSCALLKDGGVVCWGANGHGELGNPDIGVYSAFPVPVHATATTLLSGIVSITAAGFFTCALPQVGKALCWGDNEFGSLGNGSTDSSTLPVEVDISETLLSIAAGGYHACALLDTAARTVRCWGDNGSGQIGDGTTAVRPYPTDVLINDGAGAKQMTNVAEVSAGGSHSCARFYDGTAVCWGANGQGQLGIGSVANSSIAIHIAGGLSGLSQLSAGGDHTCAVVGSSYTANCWGDDSDGQLANGGIGGYSTLPHAIADLGVRSISAGGEHTCAVLADGQLACWGGGGTGQLGNGSTADDATPDVLSFDNVASVSAGHWHTCAVTNSGTAKCWGENSSGQLGAGAASGIVMVPVDVLATVYPDRLFADSFESP